VEVLVNGRAIDVPEAVTVAAVLEQLGLAGRVVVVERNGEPVPRCEVATAVVNAGDRLEIVRAVAGG
jgi:sulfur carrier protein